MFNEYVSWVSIFAFISSIIIIISTAVKDAISDRANFVGWTSWHLIGWWSRMVPIVINVLIIYLYPADFFTFIWFHIPMILIILTFATLHNCIYNWTQKHIHYFYGNAEPPKWFLCLRKLWSWLPWVKDVK